MRVERQSKQTVAIRLSADEAGHLLEGLRAQAAALGEAGTALESALTGAGVTLPRAPGHVRTEYMPPLD